MKGEAAPLPAAARKSTVITALRVLGNVVFYLLLERYVVAGITEGAVKQ